MRIRFLSILSLTVMLWASFAVAQDKDKKEEKKKPEPPVVMMAYPLAMTPGQKSHVMLRGLRLQTITNLWLVDGDKRTELKIKLKAESKPPEKYEAKMAGDSKADTDIEIPADFSGDRIKVIAVNEGGESQAYELMIYAKDKLIAEKEPNDSFKNAQPIEKEKTILGGITGNNQVDVFAYVGKAGEKVTFDVLAARLGSALDPSITLFDPNRNIITMADDITGDKPSRDCSLTLTLPLDGTYLIVLQDALDRGDQAHSYLMRVLAEK